MELTLTDDGFDWGTLTEEQQSELIALLCGWGNIQGLVEADVIDGALVISDNV